MHLKLNLAQRFFTPDSARTEFSPAGIIMHRFQYGLVVLLVQAILVLVNGLVGFDRQSLRQENVLAVASECDPRRPARLPGNLRRWDAHRRPC